MTAAPHIEPNEAELIEALAALERGEAVETILRRHRASAAALRPALELAARLAATTHAPTRAQADASRARLLAAFDARGTAAAGATAETGAEVGTKAGAATGAEAGAVTRVDAEAANTPASTVWPMLVVVRGGRGPVGRARQTAARSWWALAAGVAALLVGTPVAFASTRAVPGDVLYGVKETGRVAWLALSTDPERYEMRAAAVAAARRDDIAAAMAAGRSGEAVFEGVIEAYATEWCRISGLTVQVPPEVAAYGEAESPGAFGVGDHVRIEVRLVDGVLTATAMHAFLGYGRPARVAPHVEGVPAAPTPARTASPGATPNAVGATPAGGRPASTTSGAGAGGTLGNGTPSGARAATRSPGRYPAGATAQPRHEVGDADDAADDGAGDRDDGDRGARQGTDDRDDEDGDKGGDDEDDEDDGEREPEGDDDKGGDDKRGGDKGGGDKGGDDKGGGDKGGGDKGGDDKGGGDKGGGDKGGGDKGGGDKGGGDKGGGGGGRKP